MRIQAIVGVFLVLFGLALLFLLRDLLFRLIVFVLGFLGIVVALVLIIGGLSMIFWRPRFVWRS
ncbi:MAG: hypothetical protein ACYC7D_13435 [Nitrososphaerales archaeon]